MKHFARPTVWFLMGFAALLAGCSSTSSQTSAPPNAQLAGMVCAQPNQISSLSANVALATGYYATQDGNFACAEAALNQARRVEPKSAYVALNLGVLYAKTGRAAQARAAYQEAIELDRASNSDPAVLATRPDAVSSTPGLIARRNLANLK